MPQRLSRLLIALSFFTLSAVFLVPVASAGGPGDSPSPALVENKVCLACHGSKDLSMKLPSGETLSLYTDEAAFNASVHGKQGQRCTACHVNIEGYPHPVTTARDVRDFSLNMYTICRQCHDKVYQQQLDSNHAKSLASGDRNGAVCTDCHTSHYVMSPNEPRSRIPQTCRKCHSLIFDQYKSSVHGAALLDQSNPDVPTCIDCHGVHKIADPRTNAFRVNSPEICAGCHTDKPKMKKYGISTNVLNTYVADYHGSTVELFAKEFPGQATNKPVCYDCHGVHDIRETGDPKSSVVKENLLKTCQSCHPDASTDFPSTWMSHFDASPTKFPAVYYINLFYTIFIPVIIGGMLGFVLLDAARRLINRFQKSRSA
jgi:predicted CXXCH cytochrome family protein